MGAKTELFPTFSELCATAREVEKKPLSIPARPIDGKLVLDENFGIFPREFEEYTYNFLLFEAQKIERQLSADAIASTQQDQVASARRLTPEQQMQNDLHKFVSSQGSAPLDGDSDRLLQSLREKKIPSPPAPAEVIDYERERGSADSNDVPVPAEDDVPLPEKEAPNIPIANKEEIPSPPQAKPRVLPPKISSDVGQKKYSSLPGAPQIPVASPPANPALQTPIAKPSWQAVPKPPVLPMLQAPIAKPTELAVPKPHSQPILQAPSAKPSWQSAPKIPVSKPSEQGVSGPTDQSKQHSASSNASTSSLGSATEKKTPTGISSYSKLSPRLQALIEQKLRREEEKVKKAREDSDIFKTPPPTPPDEESGEDEPGKLLENVDAPNAWNLHDEVESEGEADKQSARDKSKKTQSPGSVEREETTPESLVEIDSEESMRRPVEKSPLKLPLRKTGDDDAPSPEDEEKLRLPDDKETPFHGEFAPPLPVHDEERNEEIPAPEEEEQIPLAALTIKSLTRKEKISVEPIADVKEPPQVEDEEKKQIPQQEVSEEREEQVSRVRSQAQSGPILIKPLFPDSDASGPSQEKQEISQAEDSDRMRRIQRIIEELSPDKMRAQPTQAQKQADVSVENKVVSKQVKPQSISEADDDGKESEQIGSSKQKAVSGKKSKAPLAPLKKVASEQRKKTAAAQEKEAPVEVLRRKSASIGANVQNVKQFASDAAKGGSESSNREARQKAAPVKKLSTKVPAEDYPEGEAEETPKSKRVVPSLARKDENEAPEEPLVASKIKPRIVQAEEIEELEEEKPAPAKLKPRLPAREEGEEPEEEKPAPAKLKPRLPAREEGEELEEEKPAPAKLKPRLPAREEGEEPEEEKPAPASVSLLRRRILPGMGRTSPSYPQTYLPPARERKQIAVSQEEPDERETQEEPVEEQVKISPNIAPLKPRKLVSDEVLATSDKTPEQLLQDQKMAKMADQLARLEAGRVKEVAGTAAMPIEEEDIPLPEENEGVPKPVEYGQAKESLRKALEHEETARKVKQEDEATVEQYAKDHLVWLYEIYKMGGMGREDFLQKASEKYSEVQNAGSAPVAGADKDAPPNPALAALSKEIEKKDKK